ncbi:zinc ribbon domain-containing protein YjdM [Fusobacterium sp. MFO224]|uniref:zinc ribbon domain-containing protein YjdM n=1 Tax=Fusobacterium sp. MFO224 TaxID=3378070 RepID=UPI003852EF6B
MKTIPNCPECGSDYTYEDGALFVCPECAYEWSQDSILEEKEDGKVYKDANGNILVDGDTVTVIKDLKIGGGSGVIKRGTKVKNIRLIDGDHDIDCKVPGFGPMQLKTSVVKKG